MKAGDLLLFDPKISHGINSVDPMKKMNLNKWNGRLTLAFSISNFQIVNDKKNFFYRSYKILYFK